MRYHYHDAWLTRIERSEDLSVWSLQFRLYPVFYPEEVSVRVGLYGVYNTIALARYSSALGVDNEEEQDEREAVYEGLRCEAFHLDTKQVSKAQSVYLFLRMDHIGRIRIHCERVSEWMLPTVFDETRLKQAARQSRRYRSCYTA